MMRRALTGCAATILTTCPAVLAAETVTAECSNGKVIALRISDRRINPSNSASAINLDSMLRVGGQQKPGFTAIFYGGQSKYFSSYDGSITFNATTGHGASNRVSTAELKTPYGHFSCITRSVP